VSIVWVPETLMTADLFGSDSQTTLPSVSLRMNLYWNTVPPGRSTVTVQTGYVAADSGIEESGSHVPSCDILPTRKIFSPKVVVAVSANVTATVDGGGGPDGDPGPLPVPNSPVWMAMALRAGTVALNDPPDTVNPAPVQVPDELVPLMTSQYPPSGSEVAKLCSRSNRRC